jgi:hypothetical protein
VEERRRKECSDVMKGDILVDISAQHAMTLPTMIFLLISQPKGQPVDYWDVSFPHHIATCKRQEWAECVLCHSSAPFRVVVRPTHAAFARLKVLHR